MSQLDKPFNPLDYIGSSRRDVLQDAQGRQDSAMQQLGEAAQLYRLCLSQDGVEPFQRGMIAGRLWEIERAQGHYPRCFSQFGQDYWIHENVFADTENGTFLEIGGYDGITGSNCIFFEKFRKWQGLIVEAAPGLLEKIRYTRDAKVIHAALADKDGVADFFNITSGYTQMSGLLEHYSPELLKQVRANPMHREELVTVPTISLGTLLSSNAMDKVDYCSLDIEGGEMMVLEGFDFDAFDITVFSIENNRRRESQALGDLLRSAGYSRATILGVDEIWVRHR